jgi:hypothetical protein
MRPNNKAAIIGRNPRGKKRSEQQFMEDLENITGT